MDTSRYPRTLPRDLFNEADLLKCLGRLWIALEAFEGHDARFVEEQVDTFEVSQDQSDGSIHVASVTFAVGGIERRLHRPLNSRHAWPLLLDTDEDPIEVFTEDGALSRDMTDFLTANRAA